MIDLLALQPHKVSRDLSGYITYIYGPPKSGKTTLGGQMPKPLILAFERGYNALPGVMAQDITSWSDVRQVLRELKKPEVKELFKTIVVDTVDIAASMCENYICSQNSVDKIGQIPFGGGWTLLKKEFENVFRSIAQLGYAVYFISHSKEVSFKKQDGSEYTLIRPSIGDTYNRIVENMADIYGYIHPVVDSGKTEIRITFRSNDGTVSCGGRFKYLAPEIKCSYDELVKALNEAIDKEAAATNGQFVTNEKESVTTVPTYDYEALMAEFNDLVNQLMVKDSAYYSPRITQIVDSILGKGKKVSNATIDQSELINLIVDEIKALSK